MATDVILPALGMSQDTGKIVQWLKAEGQHVSKGDPLAEIETDKATVEIESPADGVLARVSASEGDDVPVGQVIAVILAPGEADSTTPMAPQNGKAATTTAQAASLLSESVPASPIAASPLAQRIAGEHRLDLSQVRSTGKRIQKADVLAYLSEQQADAGAASAQTMPRLLMASPKARRLAAEQGINLATLNGSGPGGAVLTADVLAVKVDAIPAAPALAAPAARMPETASPVAAPASTSTHELSLGNTWRVMAERTAQSWTSTPHFYLVREVNASQLIAWREQALKRSTEKITYTDLLVKIIAAALKAHPRINASWRDGKVLLNDEIHVGLAVAIEEGLVVPVIHRADTLALAEIARQRKDLVAKAQAGKLRPQDISGGTFTISNLGMYQVDAFNAIINQPQAAILAVGRIAERVVPLRGQPAIQPVMMLTLSCDHRAVDGARGAQFLDSVASFIENPLGLLD